jgi:1-acyl-sn-glycerol-3-phosphate acyltransferase
MSDAFYRLVVTFGRKVIWLTSRQTILHVERTAMDGAFIVASSHLSPYDVPALMAVSRRHLDFLSITEMLKHPWAGRFFTAMNCTFVDRAKVDSSVAHALAGCLRRGRVVAMFPEGNVRDEKTSVISGAPFKPGVVRLAQLANVPIVPAVVLGSGGYARRTSWIPNRSVPFGVNFGEAIRVESSDDGQARATELLKAAYVSLAQELRAAMELE